MSKKFILNCPNDKQYLTKKKIIFKAFVWLAILWVSAVLIRFICGVIYMANGINPMELTEFGGDPTLRFGQKIWESVLSFIVIAPLMEEALCRLPLSFERKTAALWLSLIPIISAFYMHKCRVWYILVTLAAIGVAIYLLVIRFTKDEQWERWREKYIVWAMWVAAMSFGLMHFRAFSILNLQVFPWALATIMIPMAGGCVMTYVRVNLGFFWGVLMHALVNVPGLMTIIAASRLI